jgi:tetratricopeptide (TPR) repeat protein
MSSKKRRAKAERNPEQSVLHPRSEPHPHRQRHSLMVVVILAGLAFLLYANSFRVPWQFDDKPNIVDNLTVHLHSFSSDQFLRLLTESYSESIRFFSYFTFALNFYFGGLNVFGYHLVNLLIHITAGVLVFWFISLTLGLPSQRGRYDSIRFKVAFLTSLIFIVHPVQTQSVTYIVQRMTSMASMFYLLAMILYIKGRLSSERRQILYYGGMGLSGLLSIFSKENAFILPIFIALYEVFFFSRREGRFLHRERLRMFLVLLGLGLVGLLLLWGKYIHVIEEGYRYRDFTMSERVLTQLRVVLYYLSLLVYPHPSRLNLDYDFLVSKSLFDPISTLLSLMAILFFIGVGIWKMKKWPILSFFIFWYFGNLVIESSIMPLEMVYEHRLYLPCIGPVFLFSLLLVRLWEKWIPFEQRNREAIFAGAVILIVFPFSWSTVERNSVWRSELQLWTDCVKKSPQKGRPHYNLGNSYYAGGQIDKAIGEFELSLKLDPKMAPAHFNLGVIDYNQGRFDDAVRRFKKAISINPQYAQAYVSLGEVYYRTERNDEATADFEMALKVEPYNARAINNLGLVFLRRGDLDGALLRFKKAVMVDPNHIEAHVNLAEAYVREGRLDQGLLEIRKAIALNPDYGDAHTVLGIIQLQKGMPDEAVSSFLRALKTNPEDATALSNLGVVYRYKGKIEEALSQFQKVLSIRPNDEEAHINLGEVYLVKGMVNEAIRESEKALKINPRATAARLNLGAAYLRQGRLDQAISELEGVLKINPKEAKAHHNLAVAYYGKKEFRLALKHLDEASALGFKVHPQLAEWLKPYR